MYEAVTRNIRVKVEPTFDSNRSAPQSHRYFWIYAIEITNEGDMPVRLVARHWEIMDARGNRENVDGPGVVGEMPTIEPGTSFSYSSGCPLTTPSGIMVGTYEMVLPDGRSFDCAIPAFSLDSPHSAPTVN
ncbi:MAG: Co2+/Mg2+ efflux protein ApaG [Pseudomonadota bacterium]